MGRAVVEMGDFGWILCQAKWALGSLYRFRDLDSALKLRLIKTLVLPVLLYPPVPLHALSRTSISRLQKVQNAAIKFALGVRWDEFRTMESMHEETSIQAVNVRLRDLASKVWNRMEDEDWELFRHVRELHRNTPGRQHAWFPQSLLALELDPAPEPRYV